MNVLVNQSAEKEMYARNQRGIDVRYPAGTVEAVMKDVVIL